MSQNGGFRKSLFTNCSLALVATWAALAASPAVAQEAAPDQAAEDQGAVGEIVVTAQFRAQNLQEVPLAISAITADEIENRGFTEAADLGYTVPNASLRPAQAAFGNTMTAYIRGIGQNDFDFAFEPGVAIYIDDMYHPFTLGSQTQLMDLERVEVLRGPQGTLFGRGAIGGAIRYISKKPQGDNSGNIGLTLGDYDRVDVRGSYDFAISESLAARVSGVATTREGYQDVLDFTCVHPELSGDLPIQPVNRENGCKVGTQGGADYFGTRGMLRWHPSDSFEVTLSGDYQKEISEPTADAIVAIDPGAGFAFGLSIPPFGFTPPYDTRFVPPNPFVTYATYRDPHSGLAFEPENEFESWSTSARADWTISDNVNMALILAYADITSELVSDADGSPLNIQMTAGVQTINYYTTELRFSGRLLDRIDWTVGGFYYDGESVNDQIVSIPFLSFVVDGVLPTDPSQPFVNAHNVHENNNKSVFAHTETDLTDRMTLTAGVRYSEDEKIVNFDNTRVQNPNVVVAGEHTDWRVGLDYKVTDDFLLYASAATGYRPGSYNPRPFQWTQVVSVLPEESTAYELGVKADWLDQRLRTNIAAFYTDWATRITPAGGTECLVVNDPPGPPIYIGVPAGTPAANIFEDSLGNLCTQTTPANPEIPTTFVSRTFYENNPGEIQGIEAEIVFEPVDGLVVNAAYGWINWDSPDIQGNPAVVSERPPYVPEQNWTVGVSYTAEFSNGATLTPRVDVYGQSDICNFAVLNTALFPEASCTDAYELVNARLEWRSPEDAWSIAVGATNLADEEYFLNKFNLTVFGQPTAEGQPGRPREFYLTVGRRF